MITELDVFRLNYNYLSLTKQMYPIVTHNNVFVSTVWKKTNSVKRLLMS